MRRDLTALAATFLVVSSTANAGPITVWSSDDPPDDKFVQKADLQTGGTAHLVQDDLRFPPTPLTDDDAAHVRGVVEAVEAAKEHWEDFEVELELAQQVGQAVEAVTLLTSDRDRADMARALMFAGAAAVRAFDPDLFGKDQRAASLRVDVDGRSLPKAWVDAYALMGRPADRGDVIDGTAWVDYGKVAEAISKLAPATLTIPAGAGTVYVDGVVAEPGEVTLRPGRHWFHVERNGTVSGRSVVDVAPGAKLPLPTAVTDAELATAAEKVVAGKTSGLPASVQQSMLALVRFHGGPAFLGSHDDKKLYLVPFDEKAVLKDTRLVTFQLFAEVGGGVLVSPMFEQNYDANGAVSDTFVAAMASGGLGFELGVSYFLFGGGIDAAITPGNTVQFGEPSGQENGSVSVFPQPWGGIGAYFIRPTKPTATVNLMATASWLSPAHVGVGGKLTVGIPIDDRPSFVRLSVGGAYGLPATWTVPPPTNSATGPAISGYFRIGFGGGP